MEPTDPRGTCGVSRAVARTKTSTRTPVGKAYGTPCTRGPHSPPRRTRKVGSRAFLVAPLLLLTRRAGPEGLNHQNDLRHAPTPRGGPPFRPVPPPAPAHPPTR